MHVDLTGCTALITGGSMGIGRSLADTMAQEGVNVAICARNQTKLDETAADINSKGYSFFMGTIFELYKNKIFIKEIPIIFKDRSKGVSKIPRFEILRTLKNLFIFSIKKYF